MAFKVTLLVLIAGIGYALGADDWILQSSRLCFGATKDSFGSIKLQNEGKLSAMKLVYLNGYVSCNKAVPDCKSKWGCDCFPHEYLSVFVTDSSNEVIFPASIKDTAVWYELDGYKSTSDEIIFENLRNPSKVKSGDKIKVWYGEDLRDSTADNNSGVTCAKVYAKFH